MSDPVREVLAAGRRREAFAACAQVPAWLIYGAGNKGRALAAFLAGQGRTVAGFIDRRAVEVPGARAWLAGQALAKGAPRLPVLIGVHSTGAAVAPIRAQLKAEGFTEVWTLPEVVDAWPALRHFWLAPAEALLSQETALSAAYGKLVDEPSRALYLATLRQRLLGDFDALPEPDFQHQYFPPDLPPLPARIALVDCGAYTGDTLKGLQASGVGLDRVAAFEPDPKNYRELARAAQGLDAALFPCGVWDTSTTLRFSSDDAAGHLSDTGEVAVPVVALDEALPGFTPDLIKFDIEGAEPRALEGCRGMVTRSRPRLAVSAYHEPEHLFSLLLQLDGWGLGYRFALRSHGYNGFDTVLYALP